MDPPAESAATAALPDWAAERLAEFERHLAAERGLSPHTVRAYLGDVTALLEHACQDGLDDLAGLDITVIRGWLAVQHASGRPARRWPGGPRPPGRSPRSRTPAAGWPATPGRCWARPRPHRAPPGRPAPGRRWRRCSGAPRGRRGAQPARRQPGCGRAGLARHRDHGTALRDRHPGQRAVRARPGRHRRRAPDRARARQGQQGARRPGRPARGPGRAALARRRAPGAGHRSAAGPRSSWARGAGGSTRGRRAGSCTPGSRPAGRAGHRAARPAALRGHPPARRAAPTSAACRRSSATRRWRPRRSTPTCRSSGCCPPTARRTRGPDAPCDGGPPCRREAAAM